MAWFYEKLLRPILFLRDAETAHEQTLHLLAALSRRHTTINALRHVLGTANLHLPIKVFGIDFPNPIGVAAGLDKNAEALPIWTAFGFGFVEIGTVTAKPQSGNPRPRIFRLKRDEALLNCLGFPNDGAEKIAERLASFRTHNLWPNIPVGINIGKSATVALADAPADYVRCFELLRDFGDFFVVNVSSPNTPHLRELQERARLEELLAALQTANRSQRPLLLKISPDLTTAALNEVIEVCQSHRIAGIVATNTTVDRSTLNPSTSSGQAVQQGGISGKPLRERSTEFVCRIAQITAGKLPIIGVGGIASAADAYEKIRAGASLVELYTGFVYQGPWMTRRMIRSLRPLLARDGFAGVSEAIGTKAA